MSATASDTASVGAGARTSALGRLFRSSVGQKAIMALTGVALCVFVLGHMLGNLQAFQGPVALDLYGAALRKVPAALWIARIGLLVTVALHVWAYLMLTGKSWAARPTDYQQNNYREASYASRTMRWTGPLLAAFIVFHLGDLTLGAFNPGFEEGAVYRNLVASLQRGAVAVFYLVAMGALALHLWHGVWSLFQTLGFSQPRHESVARRVATVFTLIVVIGFAVIPLAVMAGVLHR